ncbi:MAG: putative ABC transport system permease protein [Roseivirga sp.]|jgi:putative ABC transport system permease protein
MQSLDLGFDKERVVAIIMSGDTNMKYELLQTELDNQADIIDVTATTQQFGNSLHQTNMHYRADTALIQGSSSFVVVDDNVTGFYKMEIIEGRGQDRSYTADLAVNSFIINETLAKELSSSESEVLGILFTWEEMIQWGLSLES